MSSEVLIRVQNLSKAYRVYSSPRERLQQFLSAGVSRLLGSPEREYGKEFHALQDISFSVGRGETVGIVGRNGSGKSTLLQIICGTLASTHGTVSTQGRVAAMLELGSGFNPEFTGRENIYLNASILGLSKAEVDARYEDILRFADIGDFVNQPLKTYSSGMVVRLAFATSIHVQPDLLVIDEALAVGDTAFQQKCLSRIRAMQESGVTILLVTHSSNALIEFCDRGIYLKKGRLVMDGDCREVVKLYADDLVEEEGGVVYSAPVRESADSVAPTSGSLDKVALEAVEGELPNVVDEQRLEKTPGEESMVMSSPSTQKVSDLDPIDFAPIMPSAMGGLKPLPSHSSQSAIHPISVGITDIYGEARVNFDFRDVFEIRCLWAVSELLPDPCFGIQLLSVDGISLWSTTTLNMDMHSRLLEPGVHEVVWRLRANMCGGRYVFALGAGRVIDGEYKRYSRIDYAGHIDILPQRGQGAGWVAAEPRFALLETC
ncbi:ABC-type polysaccharide/polyol phosphate transport system, ATPase component [Solilutibacter tolerans]|uniref:ABC-type polysaccharide/polyol phosphate transport system, ATPase component n=1 Tax=Solilutibacter tolerans TaxID=1604334 RepID=A0A1N6N7Y5_9GAMM|nr:ABC-type polysaccharide/polyol phosphate transport system, ATPase component [Lysobacter tolerans]